MPAWGFICCYPNPPAGLRIAPCHSVLLRLANRLGKHGSVRDLGECSSVNLALEEVYRMMDHLDEPRIAWLNRHVADLARELVPTPLEVLFFDCTSLYFESTREDESDHPSAPTDPLRQFGCCKNGKPHRVQVLSALDFNLESHAARPNHRQSLDHAMKLAADGYSQFLWIMMWTNRKKWLEQRIFQEKVKTD